MIKMLDNLSILVTTFLRDGCLVECINRILNYLPGAKLIVVDDGHRTNPKWFMANDLIQSGHEYVFLDFDSGLPAKRNAGVKVCKTKYLLMGCDDFDFRMPAALTGIEKLKDILDRHPEIDVASGRRSNEPYEGFLSIVPGQYIKETRLVPDGTKEFYKVDLTVNYFLARTEV